MPNENPAKKGTRKIGTQFTGALAERMLRLKTASGLPANLINELIIIRYLPDLESGRVRIVTGANGPELVDAEAQKSAA